MSDGFDRFPRQQIPCVAIPLFALPEFCPGMSSSRLATYAAVRSLTWRKGAPKADRTTALAMVAARFGQSRATVERNLAWLEEQGLTPPDVLAMIRKPGKGGAGGR